MSDELGRAIPPFLEQQLQPLRDEIQRLREQVEELERRLAKG